MMQLNSNNPNELVLVGDFPNMQPDLMFKFWTKPELIKKWWPKHAEIEPRVGGIYHFFWPHMNWHLRGNYITFEPGKKLSFTWKWDHIVNITSEKEVMVIFEPEFQG
jgi:uncharacterized protein YndB with AHSA1/START domain